MEHEAFLKALKKFGKEWKKVATMVKTRPVVQTRTHAQKYFQKLQKVTREGDGGIRNDGTIGSTDVHMTPGEFFNLRKKPRGRTRECKLSCSRWTPQRRGKWS